MIINQFVGLHNKENARSIPDNALASAVDIDLSDAGVITQRAGYALTKSISNVTTAYTTQAGITYLVAGGTLYRVDAGLNLLPLCASTATAFCDSGEVLFTSDALKIQNDTVTYLNIPASDSPPQLTAAPGLWPAGAYSAVFTYRNAAGMEGPTSPLATLTLAANQCVVVAPPPVIAGHTAIVYMTTLTAPCFMMKPACSSIPHN